MNALLVTAVINAVVNAGMAWLSAGGRSRIPLWSTPFVGGPSTLTDTAGTLFILPLITTIILTAVVRRELRRGRLDPLTCRGGIETLRLYLPPRPVGRGAVLGAICFVLLAPPVLALLLATGFGDISTGAFVVYKAIFGVLYGTLMTPLIAVLAIGSGVGRAPEPILSRPSTLAARAQQPAETERLRDTLGGGCRVKLGAGRRGLIVVDRLGSACPGRVHRLVFRPVRWRSGGGGAW